MSGNNYAIDLDRKCVFEIAKWSFSSNSAEFRDN